MTSGTINTNPNRLPENLVTDAFHVFLKKALAQAKAEKLLDDDTLESAAADIMIAGPALCLFFAALRSTSTPPSVPLPLTSASGPVLLSEQTCPPTFINFFALWSSCVPGIQSLTPSQRYDLARVICDQAPASSNIHVSIPRLAADLRAVAIEISQRRSFQTRYGSDIQAVLDADPEAREKRTGQTKFVPPPAYYEDGDDKMPPTPSTAVDSSYLSAPSPSRSPSLSPRNSLRGHSPSRGPQSPTILAENDPIIDFIRETLYAALADVLALASSLRTLMQTDPSRAYFGAVSLAVLEVATTAVTPAGDVHGVLGQQITFNECPDPLKPFMSELAAIAAQVQDIGEEDDKHAMELLAEGRDQELAASVTRMDRLKRMLERGVGAEESESPNGRAMSLRGTTIQLANKINGLALRMTQLPAFRERQNDMFKIVSGAR